MVTEKETGRFVKFTVNVYVIAGHDGLVFDSGYGTRRTRRFLSKEIRSIEATMNQRGDRCNITRAIPSHSHWDHFSGLKHLRESLGLRILATKRMVTRIDSSKSYRRSFKGEMDGIEVQRSGFARYLISFVHCLIDEASFRIFGVSFLSDPDDIIEENTPLSVNGETWEVIHAPGHCDDHIVLYNKERGILLGGDTILRTVTTWLGPPRSDLEAYIKTLEMISGLPNLKLILTAHGSPITEPHKRIADSIAHRRKRTQDVLDVIKRTGKKGISFNGIFKTVYPDAGLYDRYIVRGWIIVTLHHLQEHGAIENRIEGGRRLFVAV